AGAVAGAKLEFSPRGDLLAASSEDGLRLWEVDTGRLLQTIPHAYGPAPVLRFSPDGTRLVAAGSKLRVYQFQGARESRNVVGHPSQVFAPAAPPRRPWLASVAAQQQLLIHDLESGKRVRRASGTGTDNLAFNADGTVLAVSGYRLFKTDPL